MARVSQANSVHSRSAPTHRHVVPKLCSASCSSLQQSQFRACGAGAQTHAGLMRAACRACGDMQRALSCAASTSFHDFSISRLSAAMVAWSSSDSLSAVDTCMRAHAVWHTIACGAACIGPRARSDRIRCTTRAATGPGARGAHRARLSRTLAALVTISELSSRHLRMRRRSLSAGRACMGRSMCTFAAMGTCRCAAAGAVAAPACCRIQAKLLSAVPGAALHAACQGAQRPPRPLDAPLVLRCRELDCVLYPATHRVTF